MCGGGASHAPMQTYVLKLAKSGTEGDKVFLLLESGSRFHTTEVSWGAGPLWLNPELEPDPDMERISGLVQWRDCSAHLHPSCISQQQSLGASSGSS